MRQLATIERDDLASRFGAYLMTLGISTHIEQEEAGWSIWVRDEDELPKAKEELARFEADPENARYKGVEKAAAVVQKQEREKREKAQKNLVEVRSQWHRPNYEKVPLVVALIVISGAVTLWTNLGNGKSARFFWFANEAHASASTDPFVSIRQFELWRVITPIFLHLSGWHILFNMIWLYILGGQIERIQGTGRLAALVIATAVVSNCAQAGLPTGEGPSYAFGGMSGVVYALFGYIWVKSRLSPSSGFMLSDFTVIFMLAWLIFGMTGRAGPIANVAHFAGLVSGVLIAYFPYVMQPQKS